MEVVPGGNATADNGTGAAVIGIVGAAYDGCCCVGTMGGTCDCCCSCCC